ncbi:unnamed protein product [Musa acuminata subsp. malaccensis]|uniref:Aspergillus nuclease S1 n=1 Tax=Musa acuminata subsp. malaccensis TaxID=214687 RepID=A0A8D6ZKQ5_MUSAM|nr:unnamed protein product [Musa acuminata subsp. malaccensis]
MGRFLFFQAVMFSIVLYAVPVAQSWSKEGHILTCRIAQELFQPEAAEAVKSLLPNYANGDLSALCSWPDEVRRWPNYQSMNSLHFVNTPDQACTFEYSRDCKKDECVVGAVKKFILQLLHYHERTEYPEYNMTEALLFLSHFMGDLHESSMHSLPCT